MDVILELIDEILDSVIESQPPTETKLKECYVALEHLSAEVLGATVARVQTGARKSSFQVPDPICVGGSLYLCPTTGCYFKAGKPSVVAEHYRYRHMPYEMRDFVCSNCDKLFVKQSDLRRHEKSKADCSQGELRGKKVGMTSGKSCDNKQGLKRKSAQPAVEKKVRCDEERPNKVSREPEQRAIDEFCLIHDLAAACTVGIMVGPCCKSFWGFWNPFRQDNEVKARHVIATHKEGEESFKLLARRVIGHSDANYQIEEIADESDQAKYFTELAELVGDYLPMVTGNSVVEVFATTQFRKDSGGLGVGVGLRARVAMKPGVYPEVYGDLLKMSPEIEKSMSTYQLFSVIVLTNKADAAGHLMLGPIQLVNHSCKGYNSRWVKRQSRTVLEVFKRIEPGEEVLINYGGDLSVLECECGSCRLRVN